jgi:hypothetical protein
MYDMQRVVSLPGDIGAQAAHANLSSLAGLSYEESAFVKMTGVGAFSLVVGAFYSSGDSPNFAKLGIGVAPIASLQIGTAGYYFSANNEGRVLNVGYNTNGSADCWFNYGGYQDGTSQFRNFFVGDGKNNRIAKFEGQTQRLGVGTSGPLAKLHSEATTEQLRLSYNSTNYASFTVNSTGDLTVVPTSGADITIASAAAVDFATDAGNVNITAGNGGSSMVAGNIVLTVDNLMGGRIRLVGLPTSSSGLTSGMVWNDSGTLKIV